MAPPTAPPVEAVSHVPAEPMQAAPMQAEPAEQEEAPKPKRRKLLLSLVASGVLLLAGIGVGLGWLLSANFEFEATEGPRIAFVGGPATVVAVDGSRGMTGLDGVAVSASVDSVYVTDQGGGQFEVSAPTTAGVVELLLDSRFGGSDVASLHAVGFDARSFDLARGETYSVAGALNAGQELLGKFNNSAESLWGTLSAKLDFESSNPSVASVSADGELTALASGQTTVNVSRAGYVLRAFQVGVTTPVESVTVNVESVSLAAGETFQLTAEVYPVDADDADVTFDWDWSSLHLDVSEDGLLTARNRGSMDCSDASATVTASAGDVEVSVPVTLTNPFCASWTSGQVTVANWRGTALEFDNPVENLTGFEVTLFGADLDRFANTDWRVFVRSQEHGWSNVGTIRLSTVLGMGEVTFTARTATQVMVLPPANATGSIRVTYSLSGFTRSE